MLSLLTTAGSVLLLAGFLPLQNWANAQKIQDGNESVVVATNTTIGPAVETVAADSTDLDVDYFPFESAQPTKEILTSLNLSEVSLFDFSNTTAATKGSVATSKCASVTANWNTPQFQADDPTGIDFPLFEGVTCVPPSDARPDANCTLGGYPSYVVNVTSVTQIQLAVNFARNRNLRLIVKNKGHDFNAKSTGAGALSIWTHHLNDIQHIPSYTSGGNSGPALKIGAGVKTLQVYEAADASNLHVVGGIARTVGLGGGYIAGGGHSPLSSQYGMAADQVLALEVVLPNGTFVSVNENTNPDLFWALRGGGGSTYGIVTSLVIRAYPKLPVSTLTYSFSTSASVSNATFWSGIDAFFATFPSYADAGMYTYYTISCTNTTTCSLAVNPLWANNMTSAQLEAFNAPFFAALAALGIGVQNPVYSAYDGVLSALETTFPASTEVVGTWTYHTGSRLFPRANWADAAALAAQTAAVRAAVLAAGMTIGYNVRAAPNPSVSQDNAVNPAWRETLCHAMLGAVWAADAAPSDVAAANRRLTEQLQIWRDVSPGAGAYMSEADVNEPGFQHSFYGDNYEKLYALKQEVDPWGLLYAPTAVGSEDWYVTGQIEYYPTQNGRLCPK